MNRLVALLAILSVIGIASIQIATATEVDDVIGVILNGPITINKYINVFTGLAPYWELSGGFIVPNTTETLGIDQVKVSQLNATNNVTAPKICLNGDCQTAWPGGISAEEDPYWTANYTACDSNSKLYFSGSSLACAADQTGAGVDTNASTACSPGEFLNGDGTCDAGYLDADGVDADTWATNYTDYYTSSEVDTLDTSTNTSMKNYVDATFLTSYTETDPQWSGNVTTCNSDQKLYFVDGNLACNDDQLGAGGSGAPHWIDGGNYLYPNTTYADDVEIYGYLNASAIYSSDWSNVSLSSLDCGIITGNTSNLCSISDTDTTCATTGTCSNIYMDQDLYHAGDTDTFISFPANDKMGIIVHGLSYVNLTYDVTYPNITFNDNNAVIGFKVKSNAISDSLFIEGNSGQPQLGYLSNCDTIDADAEGWLTCGTDEGLSEESDPYWTGNQSNYYTSSEVDTLDTSTNTSMKNYVDAQDIAFNASMKAYVDGKVYGDAQIEDDITIDSTKQINTTEWIYASRICLDTDCNTFVNGTGIYQINGGQTWRSYVNDSGYYIHENI